MGPTNASPDDWRTRVRIDPAIHHGEPCIAGTRVSVNVILGSLADGDTPEQILKSYPQLTAADIQAALRFAAEAVHGFSLISLRRAS